MNPGGRVLALLTDAYGSRGGIAQHNRLLLEVLCAAPGVREVVALPRLVMDATGPVPDGLVFRTDAAGGKARYARKLIQLLASSGRFDVVVCGHLGLLPLGVLAAMVLRVPLVQIVHGIEAWEGGGALNRLLIRRVDRLVSVSHFTLGKLQQWARLPPERAFVIPNALDPAQYGPGPKRPDLLARYGLEGKKVILTMSRLASSERYKGHDEILEALPAIVQRIPDVAYLIAGEGDDRPRLEQKVRDMGVEGVVTFIGYVRDDEKVDHFRLADVFAMPGRGEGFGIVYLEAIACGVPVVASRADASQEVVSYSGHGEAVDPGEPSEVIDAICRALDPAHVQSTHRAPFPFTRDRFAAEWRQVLQGIWNGGMS